MPSRRGRLLSSIYLSIYLTLTLTPTLAPNQVRRVPCGPLGDWFSALRLTTIDFFSLDVEGAELVVLQTLNWEALTIGVLLVECAGAGHYGCKSRSDVAIGSYLAKRGLVQLGSYRARHDILSLPQPNSKPKPKPKPNPYPNPSPTPTHPNPLPPTPTPNQARYMGPRLRQRQPPTPQPERVAGEWAHAVGG